MSWDSEADFVDHFIASAHLISCASKSRCVQVWREVRTGYGRPDVVVIQYKRQALEKRPISDAVGSPLSTGAAYAITYLTTRRWISREHLGTFLKCFGQRLDTVVQELISRRLIVTEGHLIKARPRDEILAVRNIWVFEAKLDHWKSAVQQAERHLWFTNDSYVLMPKKRDRLAYSISAECNRRGIGLSLFSREAGLQTPLRPRQSGFINSPLLWTINEQLLEKSVES